MNNFIEYFYGIKVDKIVYEKNSYSFIYNRYFYKLYVFDNSSNTDFLINVNKKMLGNTLVSEIIKNRNGEVLSIYNNIGYILMRIYVNVNKGISLKEVVSLSNSLYKDKLMINWGNLWERKMDYLENLINENGKKYPLIVDSFNYFVGLAENAISYYNTILIDENYKFGISHRKIKIDDTIEELYNPLNIIFDYKVRDVAEYMKISFFNGNKNALNEFIWYLNNNYLSIMEAKLLIARLLYPSFYFDMYEDIMIDEKEEKIITNILIKIDEYEIYLAKLIEMISSKYGVDDILWLKKKIIQYEMNPVSYKYGNEVHLCLMLFSLHL